MVAKTNGRAVRGHFFGTKMAAVTLIDSDRQWFKSEIGLGEREVDGELTRPDLHRGGGGAARAHVPRARGGLPEVLLVGEARIGLGERHQRPRGVVLPTTRCPRRGPCL